MIHGNIEHEIKSKSNYDLARYFKTHHFRPSDKNN
jgi:hypothetical protein